MTRSLKLALVFLVTVAIPLAAQASGLDTSVLDLVSAAGVFVASIGLGFVKKHTTALDGTIGRAVKPLQPALVFGAGLALPWLGAKLGLTGPIDPAVFVTAPTATLLAVTARELRARAFPSSPTGGGGR